MGVKRFTSFMATQQKPQQVRLAPGDELFVDGSAFMYFIVDSLGQMANRENGGDYEAISHKASEVVLQWLSCGLKVTFLFDGFHRVAAKEEELQRRKKQKQEKFWRLFSLLNKGKPVSVTQLPSPRLLSFEVEGRLYLLASAHREQLKVYRVKGEADEVLAQMCRDRRLLGNQAYVLSNDSDFFFTAEIEYIPLPETEFVGEGEPYIRAYTYSDLRSAEQLGIQIDIFRQLPLCLGNDFYPGLANADGAKTLDVKEIVNQFQNGDYRLLENLDPHHEGLKHSNFVYMNRANAPTMEELDPHLLPRPLSLQETDLDFATEMFQKEYKVIKNYKNSADVFRGLNVASDVALAATARLLSKDLEDILSDKDKNESLRLLLRVCNILISGRLSVRIHDYECLDSAIANETCPVPAQTWERFFTAYLYQKLCEVFLRMTQWKILPSTLYNARCFFGEKLTFKTGAYLEKTLAETSLFELEACDAPLAAPRSSPQTQNSPSKATQSTTEVRNENDILRNDSENVTGLKPKSNKEKNQAASPLSKDINSSKLPKSTSSVSPPLESSSAQIEAEAPIHQVGQQLLPVDEHRDEILNRIRKNRITIIHGETGSGKSSRIPVMLMEESGNSAKIMISQPRRIAARALSERIKDVLGPKESSLVGLRLGGGVREETNQTRLWYVTTGYLVRKLASAPNFFDDFSHLVLDEIHERSVDMDILCLLTKSLLKINPRIKLILMSATLQADLFRQYFGVPDPALFVGAKRFPLQEIWLDSPEVQELEQDAPVRTQLLKEFENSIKRANMVQSLKNGGKKRIVLSVTSNMTKLQYAMCVDVVLHLAKSVRSSILIFVSGMADIEELVRRFEDINCNTLETKKSALPILNLVAIHSLIPYEDQLKAWDATKDNELKVIIATNSAESSITLPDVDNVICFGTRREIEYDAASESSRLIDLFVSQASAAQRAGRTARTKPGTVWRLYTKDLFDAFEPYDVPEMRSAPLDKVVLELKSLRDGPVIPLLQEVIDPPSLVLVQKALERLTGFGLITSSDDEISLRTHLGVFVGRLGVDLNIGVLCYQGAQIGVLPEAIGLAAILSLPQNPFRVATPLIHKDPCEYHDILMTTMVTKADLDGGIYSDTLATLRLLSVWEHNPRTGFRRQFAARSGIALQRMQGLSNSYRHLKSTIASFVDRSHSRNILDLPHPSKILQNALVVNRLRFLLFARRPGNLISIKTKEMEDLSSCGNMLDPSKVDTRLVLKDTFLCDDFAQLFPSQITWRLESATKCTLDMTVSEIQAPEEIVRKSAEFVLSPNHFVSRIKAVGEKVSTPTHTKQREQTLDLMEALAASTKMKRSKKGKEKGSGQNQKKKKEEAEKAGAAMLRLPHLPPLVLVTVTHTRESQDRDSDDSSESDHRPEEPVVICVVLATDLEELCGPLEDHLGHEFVKCGHARLYASSHWKQDEVQEWAEAGGVPYVVVHHNASKIQATGFYFQPTIDDFSSWGIATKAPYESVVALPQRLVFEHKVMPLANSGLHDIPLGLKLLTCYSQGNRPRGQVNVVVGKHAKSDSSNWREIDIQPLEVPGKLRGSATPLFQSVPTSLAPNAEGEASIFVRNKSIQKVLPKNDSLVATVRPLETAAEVVIFAQGVTPIVQKKANGEKSSKVPVPIVATAEDLTLVPDKAWLGLALICLGGGDSQSYTSDQDKCASAKLFSQALWEKMSQDYVDLSVDVGLTTALDSIFSEYRDAARPLPSRYLDPKSPSVPPQLDTLSGASAKAASLEQVSVPALPVQNTPLIPTSVRGRRR